MLLKPYTFITKQLYKICFFISIIIKYWVALFGVQRLYLAFIVLVINLLYFSKFVSINSCFFELTPIRF